MGDTRKMQYIHLSKLTKRLKRDLKNKGDRKTVPVVILAITTSLRRPLMKCSCLNNS